MKRFIMFTFIFLLFLSSCSKTNSVSSPIGKTYIDDLDREVVINKADRVAILIGSFADIWCLAGGKDSIVATADDTWTQFDLDLSEDVIKIGAIKAPSLEKILSSSPDLIIASSKTSADVALKETFEDMNIPVLYFSVSTFDDYLHMLDICTSITGKKENYNLYGISIKEQIQSAKDLVDGKTPTVLYVRASNSTVKIKNSERSVLGEMLKDLGCINIADSEKGLLDNLSMETIIKKDPDYIFAVLQSSTPEKAQASLEKALLNDPAWNSLTAVKEGRFIMLDQSLYNMKPNAKWGEAYIKLARILYEK